MLKILINTAIGVILIFIWSRFVNLSQIFLILSSINLAYLGPIFIFLLISPIIRSVRLKIFLSNIKQIKLKDLIFLNGSAMILNFFIPIRAGEIAKGIFLHTEYKLALVKAIVWIFLDRFLDFLVVLFLTVILLSFGHFKLSETFQITVVTVFIVMLTITYLTVFQVKLAKKIIIFIKYLLIEKHIKIYFGRASLFILDSFSVLQRSPKDLSSMVGLSILAYICDAMVWYLCFIAIGFKQDFLKMFLGLLLSALTYLVPAAPGYIGSVEASGLLILSGIFGIAPNLSSAMTVLFHILSAIFVIIYGLISIFSLKINLRLILDKALKRK